MQMSICSRLLSVQ